MDTSSASGSGSSGSRSRGAVPKNASPRTRRRFILVQDNLADDIRWYTVTDQMMSYLECRSDVQPEGYEMTMYLWFQDAWEHLRDPPKELTSRHFFACFRNNHSNTVRTFKMMSAANNLAMSRLREDVVQEGTSEAQKNSPLQVPYSFLVSQLGRELVDNKFIDNLIQQLSNLFTQTQIVQGQYDQAVITYLKRLSHLVKKIDLNQALQYIEPLYCYLKDDLTIETNILYYKEKLKKYSTYYNNLKDYASIVCDEQDV